MHATSALSVRVPGSSANLGPGFDVLGMAVTVHADIGTVDSRSQHTDGPALSVEGRHPALVAYRAAGGTGSLWVRSAIPSGRGLGFSGAMRVGGAALGLAESSGVLSGELQAFIEENRRHVLNLAAELEGHADNAAASLHGGVVACVDVDGSFESTGVRVAEPFLSDASIVVWIPHEQTATSESRSKLTASVPRADAVFNLARLAQLVLALSSGDEQGLALGVEDRLHQSQRFEHVPMSRRALDSMRTSGAVACWLSGSGPTVASLVRTAHVAHVEAALEDGDFARMGRTMRLGIDRRGLHAAR